MSESSDKGRLEHWPPDFNGLDPSWTSLIKSFMNTEVGCDLSARLRHALAAGKTIFPSEPFRALRLTPLSQVRVVILGQDPYHGFGQAQGLAFSVAKGQRIPPSLRNIFKELHQSLGDPVPSDGSLVRWAEQGVLLLNTSLTVEEGHPASHARWGWESLTDALVKAVAQRQRPNVFMLWGAHAQTKKPLIEAAGGGGHLILQANHPSPLSAARPPLPFLGCKHFVSANAFLEKMGEKTISW